MAWEKRKPSGSRYFYLSRRDPTGRVRKVYLGKGSAAKKVASAIAGREAERAVARQKLESAQAQLAAVDGLMKELVAAGSVLFEAFLISHGYHRSNYSSWRKRRGHGRHQSTDPRADY